VFGRVHPVMYPRESEHRMSAAESSKYLRIVVYVGGAFDKNFTPGMPFRFRRILL